MESATFSKLVEERRSTRDFQDKEIRADVLQSLLDTAKWSGSWCNTQPYHLCIASGEKKDRIRQGLCDLFDAAYTALNGGLFTKLYMYLSGKGMPDGDFDTNFAYPAALQQSRKECGAGLYGLLGIGRQDKDKKEKQIRKNFEFFGAPTVMFVFVHGDLGVYSALDAGILLQTIMLAAQTHGLATCAQGALGTWGSPVRAEFDDIPAGYKLLCGLSIGYASDDKVNAFNPGRHTINTST